MVDVSVLLKVKTCQKRCIKHTYALSLSIPGNVFYSHAIGESMEFSSNSGDHFYCDVPISSTQRMLERNSLNLNEFLDLDKIAKVDLTPLMRRAILILVPPLVENMPALYKNRWRPSILDLFKY